MTGGAHRPGRVAQSAALATLLRDQLAFLGGLPEQEIVVSQDRRRPGWTRHITHETPRLREWRCQRSVCRSLPGCTRARREFGASVRRTWSDPVAQFLPPVTR